MNANVSMPASRNSISNRRSAIGLDCRIVRLATTAASDSRSIPHTAPVCNSGLASRRSKRGIEASATIRTVAWSTARARLRFEFSKGSRRAVPSSPREDCCCPGETDARGQYQELKSELGLDHFEARTYPGWQHHVVLTAVAHAYIQHERMRRGSAALTFPAVAQSSKKSSPRCSLLRNHATCSGWSRRNTRSNYGSDKVELARVTKPRTSTATRRGRSARISTRPSRPVRWVLDEPYPRHRQHRERRSPGCLSVEDNGSAVPRDDARP